VLRDDFSERINRVIRGFAVLHILSAQRICAALYCRLWPIWFLHIFLHFLIKDTIFGEKKLSNIICVFCFSLRVLFETFLILSLIKQDITNTHIPACKCRLFSSDFNKTSIFSTAFRRIPKYLISRKSLQWTCSMRTDTHTQTNVRADSEADMTKLIVTFRNSENARTNVKNCTN
jgi:hypothetical protein